MNKRQLILSFFLIGFSGLTFGYREDGDTNKKPWPPASGVVISAQEWKKVVVKNLCLFTKINKYSANQTAEQMLKNEKCKKDIASAVAFVRSNKEKNKLDFHTAFFKNASQFHACQEERIHSFECSWLYQFSDVITNALNNDCRIIDN